MKQICLVLFFAVLPLQFTQAESPKQIELAQQTVTGTIDHADSDKNGLFSIWLRVNGKMQQFTLAGAEVRGGNVADLSRKGLLVRIVYKNLSHSEMDDFYNAQAVSVTILETHK